MKKIRFWIVLQSNKMLIMFAKIKTIFLRESRETIIAAKILKKLLKDENSVTSEEIKFLKSQSVDIGKAIGLVGLQFIPGSSVGIIALEKIGNKRGFTVFPRENNLPESKNPPASSPPPSS